MAVDILILALVLGYGSFVVYRRQKNKKNGCGCGCSGCSNGFGGCDRKK